MNSKDKVAMACALKTIKYSLALTALCVLCACSTFQNTLDNSTLSDFSNNTRITQWEIKGRVGIRDKQHGDTANLNWRQCGDKFNIRISGPLGTGAAHLYGDTKQTTFKRAGEDPVATDNPEQLLADMGWPIPVSALFDWIRGLPDPDEDFVIHLSNTGFHQSGWDLQFTKTFAIDQFIVPAKAVIEREDLRLTVLLKKWDLQTNCNKS